jgi:raffinose/stachyose/melibiose transport system permease protein
MKMPSLVKINRNFKPDILILQIVLVAVTCVYLYPFYVCLVISVKRADQLLYNMLSLPTEYHFENFVTAWRRMEFGNKFTNSFIIALFSVLGIALLGGMASYTLAKRTSKVYSIIYYFFIAGLMIPFYMTLTSLMKLMRDLNLINSHWGLILMNIGRTQPFTVLLYVGFIRGVPNEIIDSANIDGCTPFRCYFQIIFPMVKTVTSTVIILNVLGIWNEFLMPMLMLTRSRMQTIPVVLRSFYGEFQSEWNLTFAAFILSMLPLMIVYFLLQKNIVEGIASGALKG